MARWILALDFGGTKHTAGIAGPGERSWRRHERAFAPPGANAQADIELMLSLARNLLEGSRPAAIGVSFGGPVHYRTGTVRRSDHVPGWDNVPLARLLTAELGAPGAVDNDANAGAIGEQAFGAGQGHEHMLYVTVSTGVGGGWILNSQPWRGVDEMAGEIGHTVIDPDGPRCLCGKSGCVERLASGPFMAEDARTILAAHPEQGSLLREMAGVDLQGLNGAVISQAAEAGDLVAQDVLRRGARALGIGIGNAANLVNPSLAVVGGGVSRAGAIWWEALQEAVSETLVAGAELAVVPAALGDEAPLWGALALGAKLL
jgi:glucokinase